MCEANFKACQLWELCVIVAIQQDQYGSTVARNAQAWGVDWSADNHLLGRSPLSTDNHNRWSFSRVHDERSSVLNLLLWNLRFSNDAELFQRGWNIHFMILSDLDALLHSMIIHDLGKDFAASLELQPFQSSEPAGETKRPVLWSPKRPSRRFPVASVASRATGWKILKTSKVKSKATQGGDTSIINKHGCVFHDFMVFLSKHDRRWCGVF